MPDWIAKALSVLSALSVWVLLALTAALGFILFAPPPDGIDLGPIRRDWGGWIFSGLVVFGFLTLARFTQWVTAKIKTRSIRAQHERDVLSHLDTLSDEENKALKYLVENNQRTAVGVMHFGVLNTLRSKGLLEINTTLLTPMDAPHTVPAFVWEALFKKKNELFGLDI